MDKNNTHNSFKVLLLQIRADKRVMVEELEKFVLYSGLSSEQIDVHNVFQEPNFNPQIIDKYNALFVGGASEANVLQPEKYPFVNSSIQLLQYCIQKNKPVFASCFGFQLAILALEGEILHDEIGFEMGTIPIQLTEAAKNDPLFKNVESGFYAVSVHQQKAVDLPAGCELLAFTDFCLHSFRVAGKPFWAFQFHPEVDRQTLVDRLTIYKKRYTAGDDHLDQVLRAAVETPESNHLVQKFVEWVRSQNDD